MTINNSPGVSGADGANLPFAFTNGNVSDATESAQYLIAKAMAETFKTNDKAKPDQEKQLLAYVESAISNAVSQSGSAASNFEALKDFWQRFASGLPAGSQLRQFAENQYNLYANNPTLQKLESQLASDEKAYNDFEKEDQNMQNMINQIQCTIDYAKKHWYLWFDLPALYAELELVKGSKWCYEQIEGDPSAKVNADKNGIKKIEGMIMAKSNSADALLSDTANGEIKTANQVTQHNQSALDQSVEVMKEVVRLDNLKA
jgi:hypothetical protein